MPFRLVDLYGPDELDILQHWFVIAFIDKILVYSTVSTSHQKASTNFWLKYSFDADPYIFNEKKLTQIFFAKI
jgi:hypothetical protein